MSKHTGVVPPEEVAKMFQLDLKNRALAALLAWLFPGAGHLYQGRTAKGLLYMICITSTFAFGFYLGGGKVAYATPLTLDKIEQQSDAGAVRNLLTQAIDRWPFFCQAGIGAVAIPAVVERQQFLSGGAPLLGGWFRPPRQSGEGLDTFDKAGNTVKHPDELARWNHEMGFRFELGTIYTVVAGLLNILVIYDAHAGPLIPLKEEEEDEASGEDTDTDTPRDAENKSRRSVKNK